MAKSRAFETTGGRCTEGAAVPVGLVPRQTLWTWTALDADGMLVVGRLVGDRDADAAKVFREDVAGRLAGRVQLTTNGHRAYLNAAA